jgi:multimeric flavodoxin WrbA
MMPPAAKALALSALSVDEEHGAAALDVVEKALRQRGYDVDTVDVAAARVAPCTGCGSCGLKTPGRCVVDDDMQGIYRKIVASDVLVLATPVRFGSYCAELKKVVDRFQPLMQPVYAVRQGEMHFRARYDLPALLGVGLVPEAARGGIGAVDGGAEGDAFRFLIGRLAVNIDTAHAAAVFPGGDAGHARAELERAVNALQEAHS